MYYMTQPRLENALLHCLDEHNDADVKPRDCEDGLQWNQHCGVSVATL